MSVKKAQNVRPIYRVLLLFRQNKKRVNTAQ